MWNARLHADPLYNLTQFAVTALAVFTGSAYRTRKPMERICFVAGTLIRTAGGFTAIEQLRAGERVLYTDPETGELLEKPVPETYVRRASRLVCLKVGGETLRTTPGHPFYVTGRGFVRAGDLKAGERLCDLAGNAILLEEVRQEVLEKPVRVYNFQVADFHTYHVGRIGVLVHNAGSGYGEGEADTITTNTGKELDVTPENNHSTKGTNPGPYGEANSSVDILDENGNVKTRQWYDSKGHAYRDVDMTNHGNPKEHLEWPHEHTWDWSTGKPVRN